MVAVPVPVPTTVTEGQFTGADVLIGMDIINKVDFLITNKDGKTLFTYRFPSEGGIHFIT